MLASEACEALRSGRVLRIRHERRDRWVEVHAVGKDRQGHKVMRVFQIRGGDIESEAVGWRLIRLKEADKPRPTKEASGAPRTGYRKDDRDMSEIYEQV